MNGYGNSYEPYGGEQQALSQPSYAYATPAPSYASPRSATPSRVGFVPKAIVSGVLFACIVAVCVVGISTVNNAQGVFLGSQVVASSFDQGEADDIDLMDSAYWSSGKLAGATEIVDENGIVYGVTPDGIAYTVRGRGTVTDDPNKVTLCAMGDVIMSDNDNTMALTVADSYASKDADGNVVVGIGQKTGDGVYSIVPFFSEVEDFIQSCDLRYINQETVMGGGTAVGYPSFNSPDACAEGLAEVGFNVVNFCSNHLYDRGITALKRSIDLWDEEYPEILTPGSYATEEERDMIHMIEVNGITFAFLSYTYGDNHYGSSANFPNDYYLCGFDKEVMHEDIEKAHAVADVVIVSMHWGNEYTTTLSSTQKSYAEFLADEGVDLVLGTHAHIVQPTKYVTGPETGNVVPVVFGLSDFISCWSITDTIFSGIFYCEFVRTTEGVELQNLLWYPTIEYSETARSAIGNVRVRFLKDMTVSEINNNKRIRYLDCKTETKATSTNIYPFLTKMLSSMGMEIQVVLTKEDDPLG